MAERSDDIKQLFAHLGLNPNDYQEVRATRRGVPSGPPEPGSTQAEKLPPIGAPISPPVVAPITPSSPPAPPAMDQMRPVTAPSAMRVSTQAPDSGARRWSLIQAVTESPPQPAQIAPTPRPASPPAAPFVRSRSEDATLIKPRQPQEPHFMAPAPPEGPVTSGEERPTKALFAELQRVSERAATARVAEAKRRIAAEGLMRAPEAPSVRPPARPAPVAAEPRSAAKAPPPKPAPVPPPRARPQPVVQPAVASADSSLAGMFRRLVQPADSQNNAHSGRLRLSYGRRAQSEAAPVAALRTENIGDVFQRIASAQPRSR